MDAPDEAVGERRVSLLFEPLYPPIGFGFVVYPLDVDGGELLELLTAPMAGMMCCSMMLS